VDFFADSGGYVVLIVADVCDKGVPSALYMSVFRSLLRSKLLEHAAKTRPLADVTESSAPDQDALASACIRDAIGQTNDYMAANQNASMMFATVFIAAINKDTGVVSYIAAGHESPVVVTATGLRMLDSIGGPAIGLFGSVPYVVATTQLQPGDSLVVYSDGLVDARNPANEGWGLARLQELLSRSGDQSPSVMMRGIISSVDRYMQGVDQFDDLTVMVLKWIGR
jgi:serine phosphatase RsbU (regulator of sigma subunit)